MQMSHCCVQSQGLKLEDSCPWNYILHAGRSHHKSISFHSHKSSSKRRAALSSLWPFFNFIFGVLWMKLMDFVKKPALPAALRARAKANKWKVWIERDELFLVSAASERWWAVTDLLKWGRQNYICAQLSANLSRPVAAKLEAFRAPKVEGEAAYRPSTSIIFRAKLFL